MNHKSLFSPRIKMMSVKKQFIFFISVVLFGLVLNFYNLHEARQNNVKRKLLVHDATYFSADNFYYVNQFKNYLEGKGFTLDPDDPSAAVRRTPVYPLFFGLHYWLFGEAGAYKIIRFTQLLIFACSVLLSGKCILNFGGDERWSTLSIILYGLNPVLLAFTFSTITESLYPALIVITLFALSRCYKNPDKKNYLAFGVAMGITVLCRPVLILLAIPSGIYFLVQYQSQIKNGILMLLLVLIGAALPITPWLIRNFNITNGELIPLEKFNSEDPMNYGKGYTACYHWIDSWTNSANVPWEGLYSLMVININSGEPQQKENIVEDVLRGFPNEAWQISSREMVRKNFLLLYDYTKERINGNPDFVVKDSLIASGFIFLQQSIKAEHPLRYYVITPLLTLKSVIFQSNSYAIGFLNGSIGLTKKAMKAVLYLFNLLCFVSFAISLWFFRRSKLLARMSSAFVLIYLLMFVIIIKHFEARYLVALMPFFAILIGCQASVLYKYRLRFEPIG